MATAYSRSWENELCRLAQEALQARTAPVAVPRHDPALLRRAYAHAEAVTRTHGKTFYLATSLLPRAKRRAIRALYAFCRVSDDIVDEPRPDESGRFDDLEAWRVKAGTAGRRAPAGDAPGPPAGDDLVANPWTDTRLRFQVPVGYAAQLIDGLAGDMQPRHFNSFADLAGYAYRVASTVGLMSARIIGLALGVDEEEALPYMIKLGVALQLTNILRDVGEDWQAGRLYLPAAEMVSHRISTADLEQGEVNDRWRAFMRFQLQRTRRIYDEAWPGVALFNRDGRFAVAAACALYRAILDDIEAHDYDVFSRRAHVSGVAKLRRLPTIWRHNH